MKSFLLACCLGNQKPRVGNDNVPGSGVVGVGVGVGVGGWWGASLLSHMTGTTQEERGQIARQCGTLESPFFLTTYILDS